MVSLPSHDTLLDRAEEFLASIARGPSPLSASFGLIIPPPSIVQFARSSFQYVFSRSTRPSFNLTAAS